MTDTILQKSASNFVAAQRAFTFASDSLLARCTLSDQSQAALLMLGFSKFRVGVPPVAHIRGYGRAQRPPACCALPHVKNQRPWRAIGSDWALANQSPVQLYHTQK